MKIEYQGVRKDTIHRDFNAEFVNGKIHIWGTRGGHPFDRVLDAKIRTGKNALYNFIERNWEEGYDVK